MSPLPGLVFHPPFGSSYFRFIIAQFSHLCVHIFHNQWIFCIWVVVFLTNLNQISSLSWLDCFKSLYGIFLTLTYWFGAPQNQAEWLNYPLSGVTNHSTSLWALTCRFLHGRWWSFISRGTTQTSAEIQRKRGQWRRVCGPLYLRRRRTLQVWQTSVFLLTDTTSPIVLACWNVVTNNNHENPLSSEMLTFNSRSQHQSVLCKRTVVRLMITTRLDSHNDLFLL